MQFLLLAQIVDGTPDDQIVPHLKAESLRAWELYAAGIFRSLHIMVMPTVECAPP